jgi:phospholipid/cholesterol/gamma-HCH transport system ATP-binding protein
MSRTGELAVQVESLSKSFGNHKVLKNVNLKVKKGESLVILGSSGTGKSVLIKTIIGLMTQDSGIVRIKGEDVSKCSRTERFGLLEKCGFLFQGGALFDSLTILDNVTFFVSKLKKLTKAEKKDLAIEKLEKVGLSPRLLNAYPSELSGGMQKRAALARTICANPEIIFFDEPTTGLDPILSNVINELIIKARDDLGATTITITHDINSAYEIATDVALLHQGEIIWNDKKEKMRSSHNDYLNQFINGLTSGPIEV